MRETLVLVTSSFPIRGDGSEAAGSFVADIATELAKHVPVRVVAPGPRQVREGWADRIEVLRYPSPPTPLSLLKPWRPNDLSWIARVLRGGLQAVREAVTDDVTRTIALWGLPCGEWARRVAHERHGDYSVWMLGSDVWSLGRVPIARGMLARVIRQANHAYADGYKLAEEARGIAGVPVEFLPSTRRMHLSNVPQARGQPPYRLLFLGRWHSNKGVDLLLDALAMLTDEDWKNIERVEIQGGGPLESWVRARAEQLRAAGHPVEAGRFLAKVDAEASIARADWILIPSRIESIPVVFSDAMKLQRPVIATPVGDLPRLLTGFHCGVLCRETSAQGLAGGIRAATRGAAEISPQALNSAAREFSLSAIAERLLDGAG